MPRRKRNRRQRTSILPPLLPPRSHGRVGKRPKRLAAVRRKKVAVRSRASIAAKDSLYPGAKSVESTSCVPDGKLTDGSRGSPIPSAQNCPHAKGGKVELNFSSPRELFSSLIAPLSEKEFFSKHWEREPLLIKRSSQADLLFSSLFTLSTLRKFVQECPLQFGRHVNVCCYKNGRKRSYGENGEQLSAALLERLWTDKKATVQFFQPQQFQDELWHVISLLESYFGCLVGSNVYITPRGSQGLAPHYDDVEVFILQLEGSKHWCLYPPTLTLPRNSSPDLRPEAIGAPSHDFVLEAGDVLYFPRGTIHHASTPLTTSHSTHITISTYQQNAWGNLLSCAFNSTLLQLMTTTVEYRAGVPLSIVNNVSTMSSETSSTAGEGDAVQSLRDKLQRMGKCVLEHMFNHHQSLIASHRLLFLTARMPPFTHDKGPQYPAPSADSMVQLKWPDHLMIVSEMQAQDMMESGVFPDLLAAGREERKEEVMVYHSLANDRACHMVLPEGVPPQLHGVRFPAHYLPALSLLLSSSSPLPASSLPLSPQDTNTMLLSLWVEGLLQIT